MPKQRVAKIVFPYFEAAILLPMRRQLHEVEVVVRDYQELHLLKSATDVRGPKFPREQPSTWILPVGWPTDLGASDFASILGRFDESIRFGTSSPSVMMPGIPHIPRDDLDDLVDGTGFLSSTMVCDAATTIARAVVKGTAKAAGPIANLRGNIDV